MSFIKTLSRGMINKIAAGEVIERPGSVVKELMENALDAGATRIDVTVEEGGAALVRVVDNGSGIAAEQLLLALSPHSTSKIADADDLFRISTFGFRGEALASIAEISQLVLRSCAAAESDAAAISSNGGEISEVAPCAHPRGTTIEVRHLFFNTPVRRKYLRSTSTEFGHISEAFIRLALAHLSCHFTLQHNGRMVYDLAAHRIEIASAETSSAETATENRLAIFFGKELAGNLIAVESVRGETAVRGLVALPQLSRPNNRLQYFFLNRRFIRDRALQHALAEAYRGLLGVGRFPICCLHLTLPPDQFDVNVHPTKMEVRFLDAQRVYAHFLSTVREKFLQTDLATRIALAPNTLSPQEQIDPRFARDETTTPRDQINAWTRDDETFHTKFHENAARDFSSLQNSPRTFSARENFPSASTFEKVDENESQTTHAAIAGNTAAGNVLQCHQRYLVTETADGVAIIDQHALHERIIFERLKKTMAQGRLEAQRLLAPIPVDLSPLEYACAIKHLDFFASLGLLIEPFGGDTLLITAYPKMLERVAPREIFLSLLTPLCERGHQTSAAEMLDDVLHSIACQAAVKAGEAMSHESMSQLVALAESSEKSTHCPHGRPTTLRLSCEELDKMFHRG